MTFMAVPVLVYNARKLPLKEFRTYFITRRDYESKFTKMEMQFKIKSVYYGFLFACSLVMWVLTLIDFMRSRNIDDRRS